MCFMLQLRGGRSGNNLQKVEDVSPGGLFLWLNRCIAGQQFTRSCVSVPRCHGQTSTVWASCGSLDVDSPADTLPHPITWWPSHEPRSFNHIHLSPSPTPAAAAETPPRCETACRRLPTHSQLPGRRRSPSHA